jgi:O-antigen ligase
MLLEAAIALSAAVGVITLFVRWEHEGKEQLVPLVLLGMLVVEATIYADQNTLPRSLFHPGSGSTQLRLPEIYITLALVARLIARGRPTRIGLPAGLWLAFAAWMAVGAVEGKLYHNLISQDLYEAKDILYIVGAYALAAGVPVRRYLESGDLFRLGNLCVVCASVVDLMTLAHFSITTNLPLLPMQSFGNVGDETAALFVGIGAVCFLTRLASGSIGLRHVLALIPILVSAVLVSQRAVLLNLAVVVVIVVVAVLIGHRRGIARRFRVASGQIALLVLGILAVATAIVVVPSAVDQQPPRIPLASTFQALFHSEGTAQSAQDRLNLASVVESLIPHHLFIGSGLGVEFQYYEAGSRTIVTIPYAHNIVLDLWLRLGLIGLVLFVVALAVSVGGGLKVWRRHPDPVTAALALALVAVLGGLIATALVEPLLDEYRLATLLGVSLGMLRATVVSLRPALISPLRPFEAAGRTNRIGGAGWTT